MFKLMLASKGIRWNDQLWYKNKQDAHTYKPAPAK